VYGIVVNGKKRTWKELSKHFNTKSISLTSEKPASVNDTDTDEVSSMRKQITEIKTVLDSCLLRQK
jgi:hypothetical protein